MKTIYVKYNKVATVIETVDNLSRVFTFKNKKQFFAYISKVEACCIVVSQAINKVIKTMESLDFEVIVDESFGFDYEVKLYCNYDPS